MKPSSEEFYQAVLEMAELIPWFPDSEKAQERIGQALYEFIESSEALHWLTTEAIRQVKDWKKLGGIAGLRDLHEVYLKQQRRDLEEQEADHKLIAWKAEKRKELTAPKEFQQVVAIREPQIKLPNAKPWPTDPEKPWEEIRALEEPDPDHPGQWRLKQTGPIRTPEEFARELQQLEADLEKFQKRG